MKQKILLLVLTLGFICINICAQKKELQKGEDGFEWYLVSHNGKYGATDINGNTLIPVEYEICKYFPLETYDRQGGYGIFKVKKGDYLGAYTVEGINVLPVSRKYVGLIKGWGKDTGTYYLVLLQNGCYGCCDINGNIVTIMKEPDIRPLPVYQNGVFCYFIQGEKGGGTGIGIADIHGNIVVETKYGSFEFDEEDGRIYGEDIWSDKKFNVCSMKQLGTFHNPLARKK